MRTIGITGGTGFIGRHLAELLSAKDHRIFIFTRHPSRRANSAQITYAKWDPDDQDCDTSALRQLDAMVHLAGSGIADKRWTAERKKEIEESRVKGTGILVRLLKQHAPGCKTLVSASATGYYGPDREGVTPFAENAPAFGDFLGHTCLMWENESKKAMDVIRTVILRFGIVLGKEDGAFAEFVKPMKFGLKPILGSGDQVVSWIEVSDLAQMILFALDNVNIAGTYNAVAPAPVSHRMLIKTIAKVKGGIYLTAPVPSFLLKVMLGEMSAEVLKSCTVSAAKILGAGFRFQYPTIDKAVSAILSKDNDYS